ncbi:MAG: S8 family serine peptidase [Clostridium sp.]
MIEHNYYRQPSNKVVNTFINQVNYYSNLSKNQSGNIEVVIISGESVDKVKEVVDNLGGSYESLGYGYGIVNISVDKIGELIQNDAIQYLELPKELYASDSSSNSAACVTEVQNTYKLDGKGVVIGFIDSGIDYTHSAFRNEDGTTRIEYIYDLSLGSKIYDKNMIDEALKSTDPYSIVPSYDQLEHGTHVAGIACAGGNIQKNAYGVAPKSSIMMVKSVRGLFSLSTSILKGLKFLVDKSKELGMPLVVNLSLSTNDGAHNGTSLLEQYINTVCSLERITVVIAAGNEGEAGHHVGGILTDSQTISINIAYDEQRISFNLYKAILPEISVEIINPVGKSTGEVLLVEGVTEKTVSGDRIIFFTKGPNPFDILGDILISIISGSDYLVGGEWKLIIRVTNNYYGRYDIWLPISEGLNTKTKFSKPDVFNTLGIPATVKNVISVGSYNYINNNISSFSGRGRELQIEDIKPELVAPGEGIQAPIPGGGYDKKSGTSMATPHVSGIAALLMQWGIVEKNDTFLYGERLKYHLIKGAKRPRADVIYPNAIWGYGQVCAKSALEELISVIKLLRVSTVDKFIDEFYIGNIFVRNPKD